MAHITHYSRRVQMELKDKYCIVKDVDEALIIPLYERGMTTEEAAEEIGESLQLTPKDEWEDELPD